MRDLMYLNPIVRAKALKLQALAQERLGLKIIFTDTLRTNAEQGALYAQGRKPLAEVNRLRAACGMGPITEKQNKSTVTKAPDASKSFHGFGLAFDIAIVDPTGKKIVWDHTSDWNNDGLDDWAQVGALAEEVGLEWGGNFSSIYDAPHYQDRMGFTLATLAAKGYAPGKVVEIV